jgi:hypothetical protein
MSEPKDLLLVIEQLRRSNRRWKALALTVSAVLVFVALLGVIRAERERIRAEAVMRQAQMALADAQRAASQAQQR